MTFGEHIEELRAHMIRAIVGTLVAFFVMIWFASTIVRILVEPVESAQEAWYRRHTESRVALFREHKDKLTPVRASISPKQLLNAAKAMGGDAQVPEQASPQEIMLDLSVGDLLEAVALPLGEIWGKGRLRSMATQEPFIIYFKAVLGASIVLASPWIFYQLYSFVAVGLYAHERRFVNLTLPFSVILFLLGVVICYFLVFPAMLNFFLATNEAMDIEPETRLSEWVGFAVILLVIFGVAFQLPLFMLMVERVGIISHQQLAKQRRMALFVLAIAAALITPGGDPSTMVLLAGPLILLFELGLWLMRYFERRNPFAADASLDTLEPL